MDKLLKYREAIAWPGALGKFILNTTTEDEILSQIATIPVLRERQLCQFHFANATKELEAKNNAKYLNELTICVSYGANSYLEKMFYLATGELDLAKEHFL